jgi:hypothetical protein
LWRADGRELYFVGSAGRVMAAAVSLSGGSPSVSPPSVLLQIPLFGELFAPAPDGRRFLIAMAAPSTDVVPIELMVNPLTGQE